MIPTRNFFIKKSLVGQPDMNAWLMKELLGDGDVGWERTAGNQRHVTASFSVPAADLEQFVRRTAVDDLVPRNAWTEAEASSVESANGHVALDDLIPTDVRNVLKSYDHSLFGDLETSC